MKKVLLAIDGIDPDQKAFHYAIQLCQRIKAELNVFQVISPRYYNKYLKRVREGAGHAKSYFASTMMAATFAEAGEHETAEAIMAVAQENFKRLLPESEKQGIPCHFSIKSGNSDKEIIKYVHAHRDVVVAIYDAAGHENEEPKITRKKKATPRKIRRKLAVPIVVVNN